MNIKEKIEHDLKEAMKAKEELRLSVLRMISAVLHNKEIEKRGRGMSAELGEEEIIAVLRSEAKKRREAEEGFEKGSRPELARKEREEMKIVESYLPAELPDEDLERIVSEVIAAAGEVAENDFGRIMGEVMKRVKGQATGDRVSGFVRKYLKK